ncbi:MAG: GumC family protein [Halothece sp.]
MQYEQNLPASSVNQSPTASVEQEDYIDLQQYWMALKRRWFYAVLVFASTVGLAAAYSLQQEPIYQAKARLLHQGNDSESISLPGLDGNPRRESKLENQIEIIKSSSIAEQVIDQLDLRNDEGEVLTSGSLLSNLTVEPLRDTDILEISYDSPNPEEAAQVVNEVIKAYRESNIKINRAQATAEREFIEGQLPEIQEELEGEEEQLRQFKEENNVIALSEEAGSTVNILSELDQQIIQAQASLDDSRTRIEQLTQRLGLPPERAMVASSLSESEAVQDVLKEYQELEAELAEKRSRYQPDHPVIKSLEENRAALASLLEERVNNVLQEELPAEEISGDFNLQLSSMKIDLVQDLVDAEINYSAQRSKIEGLREEQQQYKNRKDTFPKLEQRQQRLQRQLETSQSTYEALLERLQQVRIQENQKQGNARIVEAASIPNNPISPQIMLNLALGGILGAMLGIATALIIDARDRTLKTVQEIKDRLGYTLLGSIPLLGKQASMLPMQDQPRSAVSEAFRMLQANLKFSQVDEKLKVIVLTSAVPNEGKSTVTANLGLALAELGNRVLIVDADMRRPSQHQVWEEPNSVGLSNVLVDQSDISTVAKEVHPNLELLTAGAPPPNPIALLESQRLADLLDKCSQAYDYVLIDTPPIAVGADAALLGKLAQGTLLVVRPSVADLTSVDNTKEMLQRSGQPVLGMVINGVNPSDEPDSYYYYYAQGYYYETKEEESGKKALFGFGRSKAKK